MTHSVQFVADAELVGQADAVAEGVPAPDDVPAIPSDEELYGGSEQETVIEIEEGAQIIDIDEDSEIVVRPASSDEDEPESTGSNEA